MPTLECPGRPAEALARDEVPTRGPERFHVDENAVAKKRLLSRPGEPLFIAYWDRALFLHYEIDPVVLQREVPFALDLREGRAYVSLVAFTLRGFRFRVGGALGVLICKPIAHHAFLNVRTYVRHRGEAGIYFLSEWLSNPLSVRLGPRTFGLPYRFGHIDYRHHHETGRLQGSVIAPKLNCKLSYAGNLAENGAFQPCHRGSLDDFLLERYTAFTGLGGKRRFFRIWHEPWPQVRAAVEIQDDRLLAETGTWRGAAKFIGANYSTGAKDVWMGWPHRIETLATRQNHHRLSACFELP